MNSWDNVKKQFPTKLPLTTEEEKLIPLLTDDSFVTDQKET